VGRLYAAGLCAFLSGSVLCLLSWGYPALLAGRLVQGVGAAAVVGLGPTAVSLARQASRRGAAIGAVNATSGVAATSGPVLGGLLSDALGWRYLFVAGVLFGALAPLAVRALPRGAAGGGGLDWLGGLALGFALAGCLVALTWGAEGGWFSAPVLLSAGISLLAAVALAARQWTAGEPFVPRSLLASRAYVSLGAVTLLLIGVNLTVESVVPLPLADARGLSAFEVGLVLLPPALVVAAWGPVAGCLVDRHGVLVPLHLAATAAVLALVLLSTYGVGGPVWATSALVAAVGAAGTLARIATTKAVSLVVPEENLPSGMSINEMAWMVGVSLGTALFAAAVAARSGAGRALNPLHAGGFEPYSDAFLLLAAAPLLALAASAWLPRVMGKEKREP
jgi:MFS family permease